MNLEILIRNHIKEAFDKVHNISIDRCKHILLSGINKGKNCQGKPLENGYCSKHQNSAVIPIDGKNRKKACKGDKIKHLLDTAVSSEETILKKTSKGLLNKETNFIFDKEYIVQGKLHKGKIVKLTIDDLEICEMRGWRYSDESVK